jgi:hypothetical protein
MALQREDERCNTQVSRVAPWDASDGLGNISECVIFRCAYPGNLGVTSFISTLERHPTMGGAVSCNCGSLSIRDTNFTACAAHFGAAIIYDVDQSLTASFLVIAGCEGASTIDFIGARLSGGSTHSIS